MVQSFRDLLVWQKSMQLATLIYRITQQFPQQEMYGMISQMRRCAVSIPSNIAEGHGRLTIGEYRQFLAIARASNFELQTQLEIARTLNFGSPEVIGEAESLSHEVGKMIYSILEKTRGPRPPSRSGIA
jgi:four helix bundle protein